MVELAAGAAIAIAVGVFATVVGFDRDRSLYPAILVVIASYYALFAAIDGSGHTAALETIGLAAFAAVAVFGFRTSLWVVVAGMVGHGMFDLSHARLIDNGGVPTWWPLWCLGYDCVAGGYLAWRLRARKIDPTAREIVHG